MTSIMDTNKNLSLLAQLNDLIVMTCIDIWFSDKLLGIAVNHKYYFSEVFCRTMFTVLSV